MRDFEPIYVFVRTLPAGTVLSYGEVGEHTGFTARQVGRAMRYAPEDVPWQRVVGWDGRLPIARLGPERAQEQRELLRAEGVTFTEGGRVLAQHFYDTE